MKAFVVEGHSKGKYIYVTLHKTATQKKETTNGKQDSNSSAVAIKEEIERLQCKEKRSKELDAEKVHFAIIGELADGKKLDNNSPATKATDKMLIRWLVFEHAGYQLKDKTKKLFGFDTWDREKALPKLEAMTDEQFSHFVHMVVLQKYATSGPSTGGGKMIRRMAESFGTIPIQTIEAAQKEKADKRIKRVNERIDELKSKLPKPASKPPVKKAAAKKAPVKKAAHKKK